MAPRVAASPRRRPRPDRMAAERREGAPRARTIRDGRGAPVGAILAGASLAIMRGRRETRMADELWGPGLVVWRELATDDAERSRRFYEELLGWTWKAEEMGPAGTYWLASAGGVQVGGMFQKGDMPMPTAWSSYALVDDVDAAAARCTSAGGKVLRAPMDIPNVGRFAVVADPWGAVLQPFRPSIRETERPRMGPGTFCWETLVTPDPVAAVRFYGDVFGYGSGPSPTGGGVVLTVGGAPVADVQRGEPGAPSRWATYVHVEDAERSRDRAAQLGGKVLAPRIEVPGMGLVAVIADPCGAALGLFAPSRRDPAGAPGGAR